jgi:O-acetylhomoserine/O-acetylserine sulfhydrylase-like pyridoxal-dependent enzyme
MANERHFGFGTQAVHAGQRPDPVTGSRAVPIYQTSAYIFEDTDQAANLFALQRFGNVYSRIMNPTVAVFEERVAALENGIGALATASGQAAQHIALFSLMGAGDEFIASKTLYGGTVNQFDVTFRKVGINPIFVNIDDHNAIQRAITPRTKCIFAETLGNPKIDVLDIEAVSAIAHENGIPLVVDNTFASLNSIKQASEFGIVKAGQRMAGLLVFITDVNSLGLDVAQGLQFTEAFYWDMNDDTRAWTKRFVDPLPYLHVRVSSTLTGATTAAYPQWHSMVCELL